MSNLENPRTLLLSSQTAWNTWRQIYADVQALEPDLHAVDVHDADLREMDLHEADLTEANLQGADLRGADLRGADCRHANLQKARLTWTDLRDATLRGADLSGADVRGADLCGIDPSGAILDHAKFDTDFFAHEAPHQVDLTPANRHIPAQTQLRGEERIRMQGLKDPLS